MIYYQVTKRGTVRSSRSREVRRFQTYVSLVLDLLFFNEN